MSAMDRLRAKGIEVLFNSFWKLKKDYRGWEKGTIFYIDDETDYGALILYPASRVEDGFIDKPLVCKSNQFIAAFDLTKVPREDLPPTATLDDHIEVNLETQALMARLQKPEGGA